MANTEEQSAKLLQARDTLQYCYRRMQGEPEFDKARNLYLEAREFLDELFGVEDEV